MLPVSPIPESSEVNRTQVKLLEKVFCEGAYVPISRFSGNDFDRHICSPQLACSDIETPFHSVFFDSHACACFEETAGLAS